PKASVVIGNPPFLGDKKMRAELGDAYTDTLRKVYEGRVPGGADLVCYWFEKARQAIEANGLGAAGLVSTNSIRGGKNRAVLDAICSTTRIYEAWSDEGWVNEGAAVRVSLIAFGHATQGTMLDGQKVTLIHADLTAGENEGVSLDLTSAKRIATNHNAGFVGTSKKASFDIPGETARPWLKHPNPHGLSNAEVVKPWINGSDLVRASSDTWIIDFGVGRTEGEASLFEAPFDYVRRVVKLEKENVRNEAERRKWWLHARTAPDMRTALASVPRFMATSIVAKHRLWVWRPAIVLASHAVCVIARADDSTFGILHSRFHELWSLRMGTWLGVGNDPRYTPTTCFETFPFPAGLSPADTAHQRTEQIDGGALIPAGTSTGSVRTAAEQIARAAKKLNDLREAWLNPPEWTERVPEVVPLGMETSPYPDRIVAKPGFEKELAKRTLTHLYNQRPAWLAAAHEALDAAVAAAYGWADYTPAMPDEEILKRLLALNLERAQRDASPGRSSAS
ncbi:MAG: DNA methyltransferase, partial [Curvibacter sp.]